MTDVISLLRTQIVTTSVGVRVYSKLAPQNAAMPFVVMTFISGDQQQGVTAGLEVWTGQVQIDVYAETDAVSIALADEIEVVLTAYAAVCAADPDPDIEWLRQTSRTESMEFEEHGRETAIHRVMLEYDLWFQ